MMKLARYVVAAWGLGLAALAVQAADPGTAELPIYVAGQQVSGLIRTWGHGSRDKDIVGGLVRDWQAGFSRQQPGVRFETTLRGDGTAIGGLYTGAADLALMERPPLAIELDGYQPVFGHDPVEISVATGSLDVADHAFAPVVFVHRDNPIAHLSLAQLDAIFGADRRRGGSPVRTWGDLGAGGEWANKPLHLYTFGLDQDEAQFFARTVMGGSQKWASPLTELGGRQAADALAKDRYGIALSGLQYRSALVKPLALAVTADGPFIQATQDTLMQRQYPLTRKVSVFLDRSQGQPVDPKLKEYLLYLLSREGQAAIRRDGRYLPLTPELAQRELEKLQ